MNSRIVLRLLIASGLLLGGLIWPWLFLGALLVGCSAFADLTGPGSNAGKQAGPTALLQTTDPCADLPVEEWKDATDQTADWRGLFDDLCESPAETAFLAAMIDRHDLRPVRGTLCGGGMTLRMQVQIGSYRVDFLVGHVLVVEIDGAQWHSSDEARSRDARRDAALVARGYKVLRIPAKAVFTDPQQALAMVCTAWEDCILWPDPGANRPSVAQTAVPAASQPGGGGLAARFGALVDEINANAALVLAETRAVAPLREVYAREKGKLTAAMRFVEHRREIARMGAESEFADRYTRALADPGSDRSGPSSRPDLGGRVDPPRFILPDGDDRDSQRIRSALQSLAKERSAHFTETADRLRREPALLRDLRVVLPLQALPGFWAIAEPLLAKAPTGGPFTARMHAARGIAGRHGPAQDVTSRSRR